MTASVKKLVREHMIWRFVVSAVVVVLAAFGYWSWAWLALALGVFYMVANISMALLVGGIAKAQKRAVS